MINRIDETIPMSELPTWLQDLWELNPYLARRAEKHYLELMKEYRDTPRPSISLRDKFAVEAMNGMLSNSIDTNQGYKPYWMGSTDEIAEEAYKFADAMMKARSNES